MEKGQIRWKAEQTKWGKRSHEKHLLYSEILPGNGNLALVFGGNSFEGTNGKVDRVFILACGACVSDGYDYFLVVLCICDLNLFAAKRRFAASIPVGSVVHGGNEGIIAVVVSACSRIALLIIESCDSALNDMGIYGEVDVGILFLCSRIVEGSRSGTCCSSRTCRWGRC